MDTKKQCIVMQTGDSGFKFGNFLFDGLLISSVKLSTKGGEVIIRDVEGLAGDWVSCSDVLEMLYRMYRHIEALERRLREQNDK